MLPTLLILTGCITVEPPENPLAIDDDGDGYTEFEGDCDDRDPDTFPGSVTESTFDECMKDSDGDGFGDVDAAGEFDAGTDCDDSNPLTFPGAAENESDTECLTDEDEDGWSAEVGDCDDADSTTVNDMDCDGVLTVNDCDDGDAGLLAQSGDVDCDGVLTMDDCDDTDSSLLAQSNDMDCDGVLSGDDCNDGDATMPNADVDCDGVLSVEDCDDSNSAAFNDNGQSSLCPANSCLDIWDEGHSIGDGSYWIDPEENGAFQVYCDMTLDGGWTLVGNFYDTSDDDFPNDPTYVVSGWQQNNTGGWDTAVTTISRDYGPQSSVALSLNTISSLHALGNQNLKMCLVDNLGHDNNCRDSLSGSLTLTSYSSGNPQLSAYSSEPLVYTYGRLAGLRGQVFSYNETDFIDSTQYCIGRDVGVEGEWGWSSTGLCDYQRIGGAWVGVWHAIGCGVSFRPYRTSDNELGGGANCSTGSGHGANPSTNSYGFRLYVGP